MNPIDRLILTCEQIRRVQRGEMLITLSPLDHCHAIAGLLRTAQGELNEVLAGNMRALQELAQVTAAE